MQVKERLGWTLAPQGNLPSWSRRGWELGSQAFLCPYSVRKAAWKGASGQPSVPGHMHTGFERPSLRWAFSLFPHPVLLSYSWGPPATRSHCEDRAQRSQGLVGTSPVLYSGLLTKGPWGLDSGELGGKVTQRLRKFFFVIPFNTTSHTLVTQLLWSKFIINHLESSLTILFLYGWKDSLIKSKRKTIFTSCLGRGKKIKY